MKVSRLSELWQKADVFINRHRAVFRVLFVALVLARLWLFLTMNWYIDMDTFYDSRLELNSAIDILSLRWGGAYSKVVLCKGLAFPLFLAGLMFLRIPYPVGLFLLVTLAGFLFARSLKPLVKNGLIRKVIFLFVIYNPVGMGGEMAYPYRNAVLPWVVLVVVSCIIALYLRRNAEIKKLMPWGLIGMIFTGFFWNLREDSIWFLPFILVGIGTIIIHRFLDLKKEGKRVGWKWRASFIMVTLLPLLGILIWNTGISIINKNTYGVYTTEDRTKTYAAKTLGALIRIDDGADLENDYWVSSEALALAKKASPTLATLNLTPFDAWSKIGDFSIWALRDSVEASGYYKDAVETNELYKKIYEELEAGFKNGTLKRKSGIQLSDTSGLYSMTEMLQPMGTTFKSLLNHVIYDEYTVKNEEVLHVKSEGDIDLYENVLGIKLLRQDEDLVKINADGKTRQANALLRTLLKINKKISNGIIGVYNVMSVVLFVMCIVGLCLKAWQMVRKNVQKYDLEVVIIMVGLIMTVLLYSYMVGLWGLGYDLTADSTLFKSYTTPQTLLISVVEVIGMWGLASVFVRRAKKKNTKKVKQKKGRNA